MPDKPVQPKKRGRKLFWLVIAAAALVLAFDHFYPDAARPGRSPVPAPSVPAGPLAATEADFDAQIASGVRLVDFWAEWCGPCRIQGPIVERLAERFAGRAAMLKVDVDESPGLPERYGITAIPTLLLFKDGELAATFVGVKDEETLAQALEEAL